MDVTLFLLSALLSTALLGVSGVVGVLATRRLEGDGSAALATPTRRLPGDLLLALGWGFGLVPAGAFLLYLITGIFVSWWTVYAVALLSIAASVALWRWRSGQLASRRWLDSALFEAAKHHKVGLLATLAVTVLYFLTYNQSGFSALESCAHQLGFVSTGSLSFENHVLADRTQDARLGIPAVMSGFLALYQGLGLRFFYAICGGLIALGGYTLGHHLLDRRRWGVIGLALLALNPYVLKIPLIDENLVTLAFSATVIPMLFRRDAPWLLIGLFASLLLGMRLGVRLEQAVSALPP